VKEKVIMTKNQKRIRAAARYQARKIVGEAWASPLQALEGREARIQEIGGVVLAEKIHYATPNEWAALDEARRILAKAGM